MNTLTSIALEDILVVKLGGGEGLDLEASIADLARAAGDRPLVVVHGVSAEANRLCEVRGVPVRMMTSPSGHSSRYTNAETRDIYVEAAANMSERIVSLFASHGIRAERVEAALTGTRKRAVRAMVNGRIRVIRDNYTGTVENVAVSSLIRLLEQGIIPVVPPQALSDEGWLNVDGDRAAAAVGGALGARDLIILSNVRGLYRSFPDESSFVASVPRTQINAAMDWAQGRMKRKVLGAQEALDGGVQRVMIADGRVSRPVESALNGAGTVFTQ